MKCPYNCRPGDFDDWDAVDGSRSMPDENSVFICYHCGGWYEVVDGTPIKYTPTAAQLAEATRAMQDSRKRSTKAYRRGKTIKPPWA